MNKQQIGHRSWLLLVVSGLWLGLMAGCMRQKPANQQVVQSKSAWYLYQKPNQNVQRLCFYPNHTVSVQHVDLLGDKKGSSVLNTKFTNPTYQSNKDGHEITIATTPPRMILAVKKAYQGKVAGYQVKGWQVTYQGATWKLVQIASTNHQQVKKYRQKQKRVRQAHLSKHHSDQLGTTLMKHLQKPQAKLASAQLAGKSIAGEYNYRALLALSRAYGHLSIDRQGHFTNTLYIHDKQSKNNSADNPVMLQQQTISGHLKSLYGKLYFQPENLLTVNYYTSGQNPDNPAIKSINLATNSKKYGKNIKLSQFRLEQGQKNLLLFNQDLHPVTDDGTQGLQLYPADKGEPTLKQQYDKLYQHYRDLKQTPVASNADLRQLVSVLADQNQSQIAGIGVNLTGKFSVTQDPKSFIGIDRNGRKQPPRQYLAMLEPAVLQDKKSKQTVNTPAGEFLIFGFYQKQLYLLQQPDADSTTTTWTGFKRLPAKLPVANITWN
ncbi:hypothetical protein MOO45_07080 [Bombilactobacillus folatiphilus]|uniref:Lipoprotein n=1 Tax=Bombilactobacillus folatiphilus TaxID=2923362 RepID=A0ABY4P8L0_9LACO|nr:hypothetical protein [Bombilactobacillus folatiphilus]UQS81945.1 hypothetical protein MOO45_07080 [Bombilactobacillus folatiphilus]